MSSADERLEIFIKFKTQNSINEFLGAYRPANCRTCRLAWENDGEASQDRSRLKWDVPVFSHNGLVLALAAFKGNVKMNFFQGASLPDSHKLFNSGLEAKKTRAIDFHEKDKINEPALKDLIRAAVAHNRVGSKG